MAMIRDTSIESYNRIQSEGLLSKLRWAVYNHIFHNGPCTGPDTENKLGGSDNGGHFTNSITPRFAELERLGVIKSVGYRKSELTDHRQILWDVTRNIPDNSKLKVESKSVLKEREACAMIADGWDSPMIAQLIRDRRNKV